MVWPLALTSNSDILKYVFEQGLTRLLQSGNDFSDLHQGVAEEIRIWLEANGVPDADNIMNSSDFKSAAIHLFASKVIRSYDAAKANEYSNKYIALMPVYPGRLEPGSRGLGDRWKDPGHPSR